MNTITHTITDDYVRDLVREADLDWHQGFDLEGDNRYAKLIWNTIALEEKRHAAKVAELEARIDALMLEHCPDEMTPEQVAEWAKHQKPAEEAAPVKCIDYQATIESLRARIAALEAQAAQPAQVAAPTQAPLADKETIRNACRALDPEDACGWSFEQGWRAAEAAMLAAAPKREGGATEGVDWTLQTR